MKSTQPENYSPASIVRQQASPAGCKKIIIPLILSMLACIPQTIHADCYVTLQWDMNEPSPEGYQMYGREEGHHYDHDAPWWQGDSTFNQCTIDGLSENETYFFVVRAFSGNAVSADSNEVRFACSDKEKLDAVLGLPGSDSNSDTLGTTGGESGSGCFIQSFF